MKLVAFILLVISLPISQAAYGEDTSSTKLGSIDGGKSIQVTNGHKTRTIQSGDFIRPGERIETGKNHLVTVLVSDGSVLVIGKKSKLSIDASDHVAETVKLEAGTLRAIVSKVNKSKKNKKFRFMVRTRAAVFGVRGTDFVIEANAEQSTSELHTLEGTVEVAQNESTLVEKGGVLVTGGQTTIATPEKIEKPRVFDPERFASEIKTNSGIYLPAKSPSPSPPPTPTASSSPLPAEPEVQEHTRSSLLSFQLGGRDENFKNISSNLLGQAQRSLSSDQAYGFNLSWNPTLALLGEYLAIRGNLGATYLFASPVFQSSWIILEGGVSASVQFFRHLLLEFGPEIQDWIWNGPSAVAIGNGNIPISVQGDMPLGIAATIGWQFPYGAGFFKKLDRLFITFRRSTPYLISSGPAIQQGTPANPVVFSVTLGFGLRF